MVPCRRHEGVKGLSAERTAIAVQRNLPGYFVDDIQVDTTLLAELGSRVYLSGVLEHLLCCQALRAAKAGNLGGVLMPTVAYASGLPDHITEEKEKLVRLSSAASPSGCAPWTSC